LSLLLALAEFSRYPKDMMQTIDNAWRALTNDAPPIAHDLRNTCGPRWVRFHSLPESKRYADSEQEYCEILKRHDVIVSNFAADGDLLHLLTARYSATLSPERSYSELATLDPNAEHWRSVQIEEDWYFHVFRSAFEWRAGAAHPILRLVADDVVREVVFVAEDGRWAYHPYDGGGDLICPDVETRNNLAARYREWLSEHPLGL
jgi:hypothetical protein